MKEILSKARDIVLPDDMYDPLDNTNYNWKENEKEVCSLGLKFVPTIRRHNNAKKYIDILKFARKLRLAVYFHRMKYGSPSDEHEGIERSTYEEQQQNNISESTYDDYDEYQWTKPSKFEPTPGQNESLELFISEVENYLFLSNTKRTVKDNMTSGQKKALKALGT